MNKKRRRNLRLWMTALCAAALCLIGGQPTWGQDTPTTYPVTRTARSNTEFQFTMPANNVEVTVSYVDAGVKITNGETTLYYETLKDAIDDAADNDEITLLKDQEDVNEVITVGKNITINLAGKKVSGEGSDGDGDGKKEVILISSDKTVTIIDSSSPNAGTIENTGTGGTGITNKGTLTVSGGTIKGGSGENGTGVKNAGTFSMTGGTITGNNRGVDNLAGGAFTLTGGTVTGNTIDIVADVTLTDGDPAVTTYFGTLADAINSDATTGKTIKLNQNVELTAPVNIGKAMTLDLNGKTLSGSSTIDGLKVGESGDLTISDSSTDKTGAISGFGTAIKNEAGKLTLDCLPTFSSSTTADVELAAGKTITIGTGFPTTAPDNYQPIKVKTVADTNPTTITSGNLAEKIGTTGNPADFFQSTSTVATKTIRLNADGEAETVTYVELPTDAPVITFGGVHDGGAVWIDDVLTTSTTGTPDVIIKWYYADDIEGGKPKAGATALEAAEDPADGSKYIVKTADLGKQIVTVLTQPQDIAGIGHPVETIVTVSDATPVIEKKDCPTALAELTGENAPAMDYIGVTIPNPVDGVEYLVVEVTDPEVALAENDPRWSLATSVLPLSQFATMNGETAEFRNMMPGTDYKLYYRVKETDDTKHGTTSTANSMPVNERNLTITTLAFDRQITIDGVMYLIKDDTDDASTSATAKIIGLPSEDDADHTGHKKAHAYATIDKSKFTAHELEVFSVIGYTIDDVTEVSDVDWDMNISSVGSSLDSYGYLTVDHEDLYNNLLDNGTHVQTQSSPEGYQIYNWNNDEAYFVLGKTVDGKVVYEKAKKNKGLTDNLTAALDAVYEGSEVKFYDLDNNELPTGTSGGNNGKPVAAQGQTVKVVVTLPTGFEFVSGKNVVNVDNVDGDITLEAGTGEFEGKYVGSFTMPSQTTSAISFKDVTTDIIQGRQITTYTAPAATITVNEETAATVTADANNPTTVRVNKPLVYTIEPKHTGTNWYALTDLGLTEGVTATIVDANDETQPVTLPTEQKVKVTVTVPADFEGDAVTFAPVMTVCAEIFTFAAGNMTYFDTRGIRLHADNENLKIYAVSAVSSTGVTLTEIDAIPANTPVIIANASAAAEAVRMDIDNTIEAVTYDAQFKGTAVAKEMSASDNCYVLQNGATTSPTFRLVEGAGTLSAHRCWIELNSTAAGTRSLGIDFGDGTTGINEASVFHDESSDKWFNLQGRRIDKPSKKGVYIKNGRKIVVK